MEDKITKAQAGDVIAVEDICESFKPIVKRISRKYFLLGAEQDDLIQEGMIGLHKAIINFKNDKGKFEPFAIMCIKQQIVDAIKKTTRQKNSVNVNNISLETRNNNDLLEAETVLDEMERKEEFAERFKMIIKELSRQEALVLEEYLKGLTIKEISFELDIATKSVENSLSRIKIKLKKG